MGEYFSVIKGVQDFICMQSQECEDRSISKRPGRSVWIVDLTLCAKDRLCLFIFEFVLPF
jgi:hypothetical protein